MTVLIKYNCCNTSWYPLGYLYRFLWKKSSNCEKFIQKFLPFPNQWKIWTASLHLILRLLNSQKLYHGLLHQVIFTYCWNSCFLSCRVIVDHEKLPLPPNSGILEVVRNVKSACNSLVHGNDTFYFYCICIIFPICNVITETCWSLRCSWSIACRRCSNYIFIFDLTLGFNRLRKGNCKARWETFKVWDLVHCILEIWW